MLRVRPESPWAQEGAEEGCQARARSSSPSGVPQGDRQHGMSLCHSTCPLQNLGVKEDGTWGLPCQEVLSGLLGQRLAVWQVLPSSVQCSNDADALAFELGQMRPRAVHAQQTLCQLCSLLDALVSPRLQETLSLNTWRELRWLGSRGGDCAPSGPSKRQPHAAQSRWPPLGLCRESHGDKGGALSLHTPATICPHTPPAHSAVPAWVSARPP